MLSSLFKGGKKEQKLYSSQLEEAYSPTWIAGQGIALGTEPTRWMDNNWWEPAARQYVDARNQMITSLNSQLMTFLKSLPPEFENMVEAAFAKQNWSMQGVGNLGRNWNQSELDKELNTALQSIQAKYSEIIGSVLNAGGQDIVALMQTYQSGIAFKQSVGASWDQFVMGLKTSELAPVQSMETFANYYQSLMNNVRANPTDIQAISELTQYTGGTYLPFLKGYSGVGQDYSSIFNQIVSNSGELYNTVFSTIEDINKQFDSLFDYIKELLDRPISVSINLNGNNIAQAVAVAQDSGMTGAFSEWNQPATTPSAPVW